MRHVQELVLLLLLCAAFEARAGPSPSRRAPRTPRNVPPALQRAASAASSPAAAHGSGRGRRGRGRGGASRAGSPTAFPTEGQQVAVLQKQHYASGVRTCGQVARVLTRAKQHTRGFKVELTDGTIGRVVEILDAPRADGMGDGLGSELDAILEAAAQLPPTPAAPQEVADPSVNEGSSVRSVRDGRPSRASAADGSAANVRELEAENEALRAELEALRRGRSRE